MDILDYKNRTTKDNVVEILDNLLAYKNCETENKALKEYVFSFKSWSEIGDEMLRICSKYPKDNLVSQVYDHNDHRLFYWCFYTIKCIIYILK